MQSFSYNAQLVMAPQSATFALSKKLADVAATVVLVDELE